MTKTPTHPDQTIPLGLTAVVCGIGTGVLVIVALALNLLPFSKEHIVIQFRLPDILVGLTIYLKTSIDFAIFIGRLMHRYPGWKNRVAIEIGSALGNIAGTIMILIIWDLFREVRPLMAIMIIIASLVLLKLAEDGFDHADEKLPIAKIFKKYLKYINNLVAPVLNKIIPHAAISDTNKKLTFKGLFLMAFSVPFLLGADDFAGYLPLFSIVNVVGFATGVFIGHMILNIALFINPKKTTDAVKNPYISFIGAIAFIALAIWGFIESIKLLFLH